MVTGDEVEAGATFGGVGYEKFRGEQDRPGTILAVPEIRFVTRAE